MNSVNPSISPDYNTLTTPLGEALTDGSKEVVTCDFEANVNLFEFSESKYPTSLSLHEDKNLMVLNALIRFKTLFPALFIIKFVS
jgi:hypothetical protein